MTPLNSRTASAPQRRNSSPVQRKCSYNAGTVTGARISGGSIYTSCWIDDGYIPGHLPPGGFFDDSTAGEMMDQYEEDLRYTQALITADAQTQKAQQAFDSAAGKLAGLFESLKNLGTAASMAAAWASGIRPSGSNLSYNNDRVANAMRDARGVNAARDFFYAKYQGRSLNGASVTNFKSDFGLTGLARAGLEPVEQYVGSYRVDIKEPQDMGTVPEFTAYVSFSCCTQVVRVPSRSWFVLFLV